MPENLEDRSAVFFVVATMRGERVTILTNTKSLQAQYNKDFEEIGLTPKDENEDA